MTGAQRKLGGRIVLRCGCPQSGTARECYRYRNGPKGSMFADCECKCHDLTLPHSVRWSGLAHQKYAKERLPVVYFVRCETTGRIKIGTTVNLLSRMSALRMGSPTTLTLVGLTDCDRWPEKELHRRFRDHRVHGEWFDGHDDILAFIRENAVTE